MPWMKNTKTGVTWNIENEDILNRIRKSEEWEEVVDAPKAEVVPEPPEDEVVDIEDEEDGDDGDDVPDVIKNLRKKKGKG